MAVGELVFFTEAAAILLVEKNYLEHVLCEKSSNFKIIREVT